MSCASSFVEHTPAALITPQTMTMSKRAFFKSLNVTTADMDKYDKKILVMEGKQVVYRYTPDLSKMFKEDSDSMDVDSDVA